MADIDRNSRLRLDAAARNIEDIGQDELRELGFEAVHPLWIVRRTMIDMIKPIESVRPGTRARMVIRSGAHSSRPVRARAGGSSDCS